MSNINQLFIRTDANSKIGIGHFMRCLALAQTWKKHGGKVTFIGAYEDAFILNRITKEGFKLISIEDSYPNPFDLEITNKTINNSYSKSNCIVLDGYHFDSDYQTTIKNNNNQVLVIDDSAHMKHYVADIILNQNINAKKLTYSCELETTFLLGTDYVLLRNEFLSYKNWKRETPKIAKKILVSLGGSNNNNMTMKVLGALDQINIVGLELKVVIGPGNQHLHTLIKIANNSKHRIDLLQNVSNMPDLMAWADMAISAAGSTCWELAYFGLPAILIITSTNQIMNLEFLEHFGAVTFINNRMNISKNMISSKVHQLIIDNELRKTMSFKGKLLVDGIGSQRVVKTFNTFNRKKKENHERENTTINI